MNIGDVMLPDDKRLSQLNAFINQNFVNSNEEDIEDIFNRIC
jgi:hypothetical protein